MFQVNIDMQCPPQGADTTLPILIVALERNRDSKVTGTVDDGGGVYIEQRGMLS